MRKFKAIFLYSCLFVGVTGFMLHYGSYDAAAVPPELLRLHIIADSDSEYDQALKAEVRDAIIGLLREELQNTETLAEAESLMQARLPQICETADEVLQGRADYTAKAEIAVCSFPTKSYGELTLPAGEYHSLRVVLGSGEGKNWWCVLFPSLCYIDAVGEVDDAMSVSTGGEGLRLRFKIVELLSSWYRNMRK